MRLCFCGNLAPSLCLCSASFSSLSDTNFLTSKARLEPKKALQTPRVPSVWAKCCLWRWSQQLSSARVSAAWRGSQPSRTGAAPRRRPGVCLWSGRLSGHAWCHPVSPSPGPTLAGLCVLARPANALRALISSLNVFLKNIFFQVKKQFMFFRMMIWNKANIGDTVTESCERATIYSNCSSVCHSVKAATFGVCFWVVSIPQRDQHKKAIKRILWDFCF